jgi:hypothetical protein
VEGLALEGDGRGGLVMRNALVVGTVSLAVLTGCGLENFASNVGRSARPRPASAIRGKISWDAANANARIVALDGDGNEIAPFQSKIADGAYEIRLPSRKYSMIRVQAHVGDMALRAIVPFVGEESAFDAVDLDARNAVETLVVEANLSATGKSFKQLTPDAYVGDGVTTGTRTLIRKALDAPGSTTHALLQMAQRITARANPELSANPGFFLVPALSSAWATTSSALDAGWLARNLVDYTGDGIVDDPAAFDAALSQVAQLYKPAGCPDPTQLRVVFTVDFNEGAVDGNCDALNRFKWARDAPGKQMFFVGWVHDSSAVPAEPAARTAVNSILGAGVPNQLAMSDDGTNGDEIAGDDIWTITFALPRGLRVGYKYTWGTRGALWTGTEEWPGNSRIIEIDDMNADAFVYRRDVFADEATNKDLMNLNRSGAGSITWTTDLRGCGIPEAREQRVVLHNACSCAGQWITPTSVGPVNIACSVSGP